MCNLYRLSKAPAEIAKWFGVTDADGGANFAEDVYPGHPGLVIAQGRLRPMTWGFPLALKSKRTGEPLKPKPVNNARTDKLDSFFWRHSFEERRCLIPLTAWAEYEGPTGNKTKVWQSLPDSELFACAGVWRSSDEWGDCYSMVMTDAAGDAAQFHTRMPVILPPQAYGQWQEGSSKDALALCEPYAGELKVER